MKRTLLVIAVLLVGGALLVVWAKSMGTSGEPGGPAVVPTESASPSPSMVSATPSTVETAVPRLSVAPVPSQAVTAAAGWLKSHTGVADKLSVCQWRADTYVTAAAQQTMTCQAGRHTVSAVMRQTRSGDWTVTSAAVDQQAG